MSVQQLMVFTSKSTELGVKFHFLKYVSGKFMHINVHHFEYYNFIVIPALFFDEPVFYTHDI